MCFASKLVEGAAELLCQAEGETKMEWERVNEKERSSARSTATQMIGVIAQDVEDREWSCGGNAQHSVLHNEDECSVRNPLHQFVKTTKESQRNIKFFFLP